MRRMANNPDRDFSAGYEPSQTPDHLPDLQRLASDRSRWGQPPSYLVELTDPSVQSRIARLIVRSASKRPRYRRW
jgi:hypothetical protein